MCQNFRPMNLIRAHIERKSMKYDSESTTRVVYRYKKSSHGEMKEKAKQRLYPEF